MKYFLTIINTALLLVFSNCAGQESEELTAAGAVNVLIEIKEWKHAENILDELLEKYPDSKYRKNYYYSLNEVLSEQEYKIRLEHAKSNPPDTTTIPSGSITLVLSEDYGIEFKRIKNKQIDLAENYLDEFPNGRYVDAFLMVLSSAYSKLGKKGHAIRFSEQLFNSSRIPEKKKVGAAIILGYYAHAYGKYEKAIEYYKFVLENSDDLITRIKFNFYAAVCYYELRDLEKSKQYLNSVFESSKDTDNKDVEKIAKIMWDYINKFESDSSIPKRHFVFFVDDANE